jgi:hypothetical protein
MQMKLLFSATLTNDPNLLSFFNLKYPYYYNVSELSVNDDARKRKRDVLLDDDTSNNINNKKRSKADAVNDGSSVTTAATAVTMSSETSAAMSLPPTLSVSFFVIDSLSRAAHVYALLATLDASVRRALCFANRLVDYGGCVALC